MNQVINGADASISKINEILNREDKPRLNVGMSEFGDFPDHLPEFEEVYLYAEKSIDIKGMMIINFGTMQFVKCLQISDQIFLLSVRK